jgi:hypothetical protein
MLNGVYLRSHKKQKMAEQMRTHLRGGMLRFAAGLSPLSMAFRACIMKCRVGDVDDTVLTNLSASTNSTYVNHIPAHMSCQCNLRLY